MKISFPSLIRSASLGFALTATAISATLRADDTPAEPPRVQPTSTVPMTPMTPMAPMPVISAGEIAATPEMWFYEQALRRYDDPKYAIRAVAEQKAAQRRARLASQQWYGYSNLRPTAGIDPVHGMLQPQWIGNGYDPNTWVSPNGPSGVWVIPGVAAGY